GSPVWYPPLDEQPAPRTRANRMKAKRSMSTPFWRPDIILGCRFRKLGLAKRRTSFIVRVLKPIRNGEGSRLKTIASRLHILEIGLERFPKSMDVVCEHHGTAAHTGV